MSEVKKEPSYIIAEGNTPRILAAQVSASIDKDYLPHGNMHSVGNNFFQPMIKKEYVQTSNFNDNGLIKIDG